MKKAVLISTLVLIISIIGVITVNAALNKNKFEEPEAFPEEVYIEKTDISKEKNITLTDGSEKELTYVKTSEANNSQFHYYKDADGIEYSFNQDGKKTGVFNQNVTEGSTKEQLTLQVLKKMTVDYMLNYFGDEFNGYKLIEFKEGSIANNAVETYLATFAKTYGENGFIRGEGWSVTVLPDGTILSCTMVGDGVDDGFKPESLNGISQQEVEVFVDAKLRAAYGEKLDNYKIKYFEITEKDGDFALKIPVSVEYNANDTVMAMSEVFYYEIPQ